MNTSPKPVPRPSRRAPARRLRLLVVAAAAALAVGGAAAASALSSAGAQGTTGAGPARAGTLHAPAGATTGIRVSYPAQAPANYGSVSGLAADGHGGAWYFTESARQDTLFHVLNATGKTARYQIPRSPAIRSGSTTPLVTDGSEVWIGINSALVGVNTATGAVRTVRLPVLPLVSRKVADLPVAPARPETAFEDVQSMTVGAHGVLDIGRLFAADLQTYDPRSGATGAVALPTGSVLAGWGTDLATLPGGHVDAVLWHRAGRAAGSIVLASHSAAGWSAVNTGGCAIRAVSQGAGQVLTLGGGCASGAADQRQAGALNALRLSAPGAAPAVLTGTGVPLSGPANLVGTATGAELLRGGQATAVPLGTIVVGPPGGGPRQPGKIVPDRVVPVIAGMVTAESDGHVWFTVGYGSPRLGLMTVGS